MNKIAHIIPRRAILDINNAAESLANFLQRLENPEERVKERQLAEYFDAARSASNDAGPRGTRIKIIKAVLSN